MACSAVHEAYHDMNILSFSNFRKESWAKFLLSEARFSPLDSHFFLSKQEEVPVPYPVPSDADSSGSDED